MYFDAIIATVQHDGYHQSKCFLAATMLGQIATENLDDRRQEYDRLEKIIIKDMATRKTDIRVLEQHVENAHAGIKQLIRKDVIVNNRDYYYYYLNFRVILQHAI